MAQFLPSKGYRQRILGLLLLGLRGIQRSENTHVNVQIQRDAIRF